MRASLATVLAARALLAGLAAVFVQLAQAQGSVEGVVPARYPVIQWSYWAFDGCLVVSLLAVAAGAVPLWLLMLRAARRAWRRRETACLLVPIVVPAAYIVANFAVSRLVLGSGPPAVT